MTIGKNLDAASAIHLAKALTTITKQHMRNINDDARRLTASLRKGVTQDASMVRSRQLDLDARGKLADVVANAAAVSGRTGCAKRDERIGDGADDGHLRDHAVLGSPCRVKKWIPESLIGSIPPVPLSCIIVKPVTLPVGW